MKTKSSVFSSIFQRVQKSVSATRKYRFITMLFLILLTSFAVYSAGSITEFIAGQFFRSAAESLPLKETPTKAKADDIKASLSPRLNLTGSLLTARSGHTATRLDDGNVLIVGGDEAGSAEIFDSSSSSSTFAGSLNTARSGHTATRLGDGRVLITGGAALATTEIYDAATQTFSLGAQMNTVRSGHTATVLSDGRILIAGGGTAEIYDAATDSFTSVSAAMSVSRSGHSAVLMNDGRVLLVGGANADGEELNSAEIFDAASGEFAETANAMAHHRTRATLRVLPDGKVQIIGGNDDDSIEIYDPNINIIGAHAHLIPINDEHEKLLPDDILGTSSRAFPPRTRGRNPRPRTTHDYRT